MNEWSGCKPRSGDAYCEEEEFVQFRPGRQLRQDALELAVKAERERVLAELRTLYLNGQMWEIHKILWPSEEDYIRAGGYK